MVGDPAAGGSRSYGQGFARREPDGGLKKYVEDKSAGVVEKVLKDAEPGTYAELHATGTEVWSLNNRQDSYSPYFPITLSGATPTTIKILHFDRQGQNLNNPSSTFKTIYNWKLLRCTKDDAEKARKASSKIASPATPSHAKTAAAQSPQTALLPGESSLFSHAGGGAQSSAAITKSRIASRALDSHEEASFCANGNGASLDSAGSVKGSAEEMWTHAVNSFLARSRGGGPRRYQWLRGFGEDLRVAGLPNIAAALSRGLESSRDLAMAELNDQAREVLERHEDDRTRVQKQEINEFLMNLISLLQPKDGPDDEDEQPSAARAKAMDPAPRRKRNTWPGKVLNFPLGLSFNTFLGNPDAPQRNEGRLTVDTQRWPRMLQLLAAFWRDCFVRPVQKERVDSEDLKGIHICADVKSLLKQQQNTAKSKSSSPNSSEMSKLDMLKQIVKQPWTSVDVNGHDSERGIFQGCEVHKDAANEPGSWIVQYTWVERPTDSKSKLRDGEHVQFAHLGRIGARTFALGRVLLLFE